MARTIRLRDPELIVLDPPQVYEEVMDCKSAMEKVNGFHLMDRVRSSLSFQPMQEGSSLMFLSRSFLTAVHRP